MVLESKRFIKKLQSQPIDYHHYPCFVMLEINLMLCVVL